MIQIVALKKKATPEPKPEAKAESTTKGVDQVKPKAKDKQVTPENKQNKKKEEHQFQAIGVVSGAIEVEDNNYFLNIDGFRFRCFAPLPLLNKGLEQGGNLYCKVWPGRSPDGEISFTIRRWRSEPFADMAVGEFTLKGIWHKQEVPGIRIYRNASSLQRGYNDKLLCRHLPLTWNDEKYPPYDPQIKGMKRYFIQVKASFDPEKKVFNLLELLAKPTLRIPEYARTKRSLAYVREKIGRAQQEKHEMQECAPNT